MLLNLDALRANSKTINWQELRVFEQRLAPLCYDNRTLRTGICLTVKYHFRAKKVLGFLYL